MIDGFVKPDIIPKAMNKMLLDDFGLGSLLVTTLAAQQVPLADQTSPFTASFDKLVSQNLDRWHTPGLAIAVIRGEDTFSKVRISLWKIIRSSMSMDGN